MTHKRIYVVGLLIIVSSWFVVRSVLARPAESPPVPETATAALCNVPTGAGRLFRQTWPKIATLPDEPYLWQIANEAPPSHAAAITRPLGGEWRVEGWDLWQVGTEEGLSVAYETARDVGDGVIEGCMQFTSDITGVVPGGIIFRYQDLQNTYGVGFARIDDEVVFAVGKKVHGNSSLLMSTVKYDPTVPHPVKIVLRGRNIKVYIDGEPTPVFDLNDASFASGKIGYGTYSSSARFGPLWADLDCSTFEAGLSPIGQAVLGTLENPAFCGNQYQDLFIIRDVDSGRDAFEKMAAAIVNAKYEVDLTALTWEPSTMPVEQAGNIILQGLKPYNSGLKELYGRVVENPENYPEGMRVRILIGGTGSELGQTQNNVLDALQSITGTASVTTVGIPVYQEFKVGADTISWQIEVATFRNGFWSGHYSHAKMLVVDGHTVLARGYDPHNYYTRRDPVRYDMGLQVRGLAGFEAQTVFDFLWYGATLHPSGEHAPYNPNYPPPLTPPNIYVIEHAPQIWSHTVTTDTAVFSLYRDSMDKTSDDAILAALGAANDTIDLAQAVFTSDVWGAALPFEPALQDAILNRGVTVRLLTGPGGEAHQLFLGGNRRVAVRLWQALGSDANKFQVQVYPGTFPRIHTKALSIDGQFLIVGSQNWDNAAWGDGGVDLTEYNLGLDGGVSATHPAIQAYATYFQQEWDSTETHPPDWLPAGSDLAATVAQAEPGAVIWLADAPFVTTATVVIDKPLTLVGGGGVSTSLAAQGFTGPALRITSGDVTLAGLSLTNSLGYAVEIGDGGATPLDNLYIGGVLFADNALGGVQINVADGTPLTYTLENNTFVGGQVGVRLSGGGTEVGTRIIRNNLFSGQTLASIQLLTANDGGARYAYNLFDQCARAVGGICPEDWLDSATPFTPTASHNLLNLDPRFYDAAYGDYTLAADSPALDAGDPSSTTCYDTDDDGDGFIRSNIGAFGRAYPLSTTGYVSLQSPAAGAVINLTPALQWRWMQPISNTQPLTPTSYQVQVAANGQFHAPLADTTVAGYTYVFQSPQIENYYWRVGYTDTLAQTTIWTPARQFTTGYYIYLPVVVRSSQRLDQE